MSNENIRLRDEIKETDAALVERITRATGLFTKAEVAVAVELVREGLEQGPASGYFFLFAEGRDGCAGYACYGPSEGEPGWFDLYWIAVEPGRQGHGLGSLLLCSVEQRALRGGGQGLTVETSGRAEYRPTRAFYEARGFLARRRVADHYAPGDDLVVYRKVLPEASWATHRGS